MSRLLSYRPEVDGLRAVAVLSVLLFHAGFSFFKGGFFGVDIFFVISGYLITAIIAGELQTGRFTFSGFYSRRLRRILPALFVVMACCIPFCWYLMVPAELWRTSKVFIAIAFFGSNILYKKDTSYFSTAGETDPLIHTWSLGVEEQFYLVFPFLIFVFWRLGRQFLVALLCLLALSSFALALLWHSQGDHAATFYLSPARAWQFLIGAVLALLPPVRSSIVQQAGSLLGLLAIGWSVTLYQPVNSSLPFVAAIPTAGAAAILFCASQATWVGRLLSWPGLVGIGLISYSAYLWHQPIFVFARMFNLNPLTSIQYGLLIALTLGLAYLSWRFVETPARDKQLIGRKSVFGISIGGTVAVVLIGWIGYKNLGFAGRLNERELAILGAPDIMSAKCHGSVSVDNLKQNHVCRLGDATKPITVALIGDSHAGALTQALEEVAQRKNLAFTVMTDGWCVPFIDFNNPSWPVCREYINEALHLVARVESIHTVILAAQWSTYVEGFRHGTRPVAYSDDQSTEISVAKNAEVFSRRLNQTIEFLKSKGKENFPGESGPGASISHSRHARPSQSFRANDDLGLCHQTRIRSAQSTCQSRVRRAGKSARGCRCGIDALWNRGPSLCDRG